jgi:hypothetical protein
MQGKGEARRASCSLTFSAAAEDSNALARHLSPVREKHKNCPVHNREREPGSKWQVKRAGGEERVFADELNGTELADHLARKQKQLRQAEERGDEQRVERIRRRLAILEEEAQRRAPGGG